MIRLAYEVPEVLTATSIAVLDLTEQPDAARQFKKKVTYWRPNASFVDPAVPDGNITPEIAFVLSYGERTHLAGIFRLHSAYRSASRLASIVFEHSVDSGRYWRINHHCSFFSQVMSLILNAILRTLINIVRFFHTKRHPRQ